MTDRTRVAVLGAGAFGTALANVAARAGCRVSLWAREAATVAEINGRRTNLSRLPGAQIHDQVTATAALEQALAADIVLMVVPAQALRAVLSACVPHVPPGTPLVVCAKGIERTTGRFLSDIVGEVAPACVPAVLSGPSFAADIDRGLPTAVTVAAAEGAVARRLAAALGSPAFRLYHSTDVRGVEIGGATKNVLAIAAGIVAGRRLGASATAAITARGFAEMTRFGTHFGAKAQTMMGLSGLGDLILSCASVQSRNFALGHALGEGKGLDLLSGKGALAEGALTAEILVEKAREAGIDMPIAEAVDAVLGGIIDVDQAIVQLMARPQRAE
ncbi:NAD(P)H-dependent glycerol-3-phosphate dehydrogenase [Phreatobacter sp.]|uniref:Glycerol-3-phosphate dehydrogenase [NAD(P)+] n=1 Tax=Microcystis aeruginosa DA14 TaxID=1987506 RepID=A0A3E0MD98_MICAE|nr:NAD(P)H-dependent glycerol-3-phosphate dehydrogenase [Phreatobacter sp.]REJ57749.1 MAG: NAD(P)-dependent glycerol-3-phosphate dehydrogenase [Microcystis aeruginosa DA14]